MFKRRRQLADYLGNKTLLVIEPTVNYKTSIKQFLVNLGVKKVKVVSTVAEAKREMLTTKVGFFICEWKLTPQNGIQFCRELRKQKRHRETPFLLISVENFRNDVVLASEVGISGYLLKPFSYDKFCDIVEGIVITINNPSKLTTILSDSEELVKNLRYEEADALLNGVILEHPNSARALTLLGQICYERKDLDKAIGYLCRATEENDHYIEALKLLLEIYTQTDATGPAFDVAESLHKLSPDNPKYALLLAKACLQRNLLNDSEHYYRVTIKNAPKLAEAYKGLGYIYLKTDELEKATKNFSKALGLDHSDISTINSLGLCYVRQGNIEQGIQKYRTALKLAPTDSRVLFNIGQAYEKLERIESAIEYYSQAISYNPSYEKAKAAMSRLKKLAPEKAS